VSRRTDVTASAVRRRRFRRPLALLGAVAGAALVVAGSATMAAGATPPAATATGAEVDVGASVAGISMLGASGSVGQVSAPPSASETGLALGES
jgi:hypothetical protein